MLFSGLVAYGSIDYILIEHIGISDKPIRSVLIAPRDSDIEGVVYRLEKKAYYSVNDVIFEFCEKNDTSSSMEFGSFNIMICKENYTFDYQINRKQSSYIFLQLINILEQLDENDDLLNQFLTIYSRVNPR